MHVISGSVRNHVVILRDIALVVTVVHCNVQGLFCGQACVSACVETFLRHMIIKTYPYRDRCALDWAFALVKTLLRRRVFAVMYGTTCRLRLPTSEAKLAHWQVHHEAQLFYLS